MRSSHITAKALLLSVVAAAVGIILIAAMLTLAANNVPVALTQAEPLEPLALPANLITGTPEQCVALPDPQQRESTECVRKRSKEYAERLLLKEQGFGSKIIDPQMVLKPKGDFRNRLTLFCLVWFSAR